MESRVGWNYRDTKAHSQNEDLAAERIHLREDQNNLAERRDTKKILYKMIPFTVALSSPG